MSTENVLPITHELARDFGYLAEMRYPGEGEQAAHSWGWEQEARLVLAEHLAARSDELQAWHEGAPVRRQQAAAKANDEAAALREARIAAGHAG